MIASDLNHLSEQLLLAVKSEQPIEDFSEKLSSLPSSELVSLETDVQKIAFWVNSYNAWYQILRTHRKVDKSQIYKKKQIQIAQEAFSLDDIEHGILRRFKIKYFGGYLPNPFASKRIRQLAVDKLDWRIHFALNCGAASCPPIAFYTTEKLEQQLDTATASYLQAETDVDDATKVIHVTKLFKWFAADFGGTDGILKLLAERLNIETHGYKLAYKHYSWDEQLGNFE